MIPIAQETSTRPTSTTPGISPIIALTAGHGRRADGRATAGLPRFLVAGLTLGGARQRPAGSAIWQWGEQADLVSGALRLDELGWRRR